MSKTIPAGQGVQVVPTGEADFLARMQAEHGPMETTEPRAIQSFSPRELALIAACVTYADTGSSWELDQLGPEDAELEEMQETLRGLH